MVLLQAGIKDRIDNNFQQWQYYDAQRLIKCTSLNKREEVWRNDWTVEDVVRIKEKQKEQKKMLC